MITASVQRPSTFAVELFYSGTRACSYRRLSSEDKSGSKVLRLEGEVTPLEVSEGRGITGSVHCQITSVVTS